MTIEAKHESNNDVIKALDESRNRGEVSLPLYYKSKIPNFKKGEKYEQFHNEDSPPIDDDYKKWIEEGRFQGLCKMPGQLLDGSGMYDLVIDTDSENATNKFLEIMGYNSKDELANDTKVDIHPGTPYKMHVHYRTKTRVTSKTQFYNIDTPRIESRADRPFLVVMPPSMHEDGTRYQTIGTDKIAEIDAELLQSRLEKMFAEYNEPYANNGIHKPSYNGNGNGKSTIARNADGKIPNGYRNNTLFPLCLDYVKEHYGEPEEEIIKGFDENVNKKECVEPLPYDKIATMVRGRITYALTELKLGKYAENEARKTKESQKAKEKKDDEEKPNSKPIPIRKLTANGNIPLHESIVLGIKSKFVSLDKDGKPNFVDIIEFGDNVFVPKDSITTQNPMPYVFDSEQDFNHYLELAKTETLDSLFDKHELVYKRYVDVEDYYYPILIGDIIFTYFQDRLPYTHFDIFIGDNGSGKNSALIAFKFMGYRVFYVVSASAANYYTELGNQEEGQITIAEDEADDIATDKDKNNTIATGYCSGGTVPKVELEGGRKTDNWLTYCFKKFAMEELPDDKKMKKILDRSFVFKFVAGQVSYNIKDLLMKNSDSTFDLLRQELMYLRKLMFCYRLLHYNNQIPDVRLNIRNRSEELTKSLIRLFANSPKALERIIGSLTKFMIERKEIKSDSLEKRLFDVIIELRDEGIAKEEISKDSDLFRLTNSQMRDRLIQAVEAEEKEGKNGGTYYYSPIVGNFTQNKITSIAKSRFKGKRVKIELEKTARGIEFSQKDLERIKSNYEIPDKIEIIKPDLGEHLPTLQTLPTLCREVSIDKIEDNDLELSTKSSTESELENEGIPLQKVSKLSKVSGNYQYDCYECRKLNHGTPKYQTNSLSDYRKHWISSGHRGPCKPGKADLEYHGWIAQGKDWEKI